MKVTLEQVAQEASVSRRTVDRVINHRGNVRPEVEQRVRRALERLDYQPNKLASALAYSKMPKKIGVIYQKDGFQNFDDNVERGIKDASDELRDFGISVEIAYGDVHRTETYLQTIDRMVKDGICGFVLRGADIQKLREKIDELYFCDIPVVTFNSDIPKSKRICFIGQDAYQSGKAAGNIMAKLLREKEKIIICCGVPEYDAHHKRVDGFVYEMKKHGFDEEQWKIIHTGGSYETTYQNLESIFGEGDEIRGIYMSVEPNKACGDFLAERKHDKKPFVICHDASEESIKYLKNEIFDFIIDQNIYMQSYRALITMKDILRFGKKTDIKDKVSDLIIYNSVSFV
ncbi:MAG: LacI family DNA-binding transcriptional regulator [Ruminococcus sp.]|jgi:LacI family transcriptional regulator